MKSTSTRRIGAGILATVLGALVMGEGTFAVSFNGLFHRFAGGGFNSFFHFFHF